MKNPPVPLSEVRAVALAPANTSAAAGTLPKAVTVAAPSIKECKDIEERPPSVTLTSDLQGLAQHSSAPVSPVGAFSAQVVTPAGAKRAPGVILWVELRDSVRWPAPRSSPTLPLDTLTERELAEAVLTDHGLTIPLPDSDVLVLVPWPTIKTLRYKAKDPA